MCMYVYVYICIILATSILDGISIPFYRWRNRGVEDITQSHPDIMAMLLCRHSYKMLPSQSALSTEHMKWWKDIHSVSSPEMFS